MLSNEDLFSPPRLTNVLYYSAKKIETRKSHISKSYSVPSQCRFLRHRIHAPPSFFGDNALRTSCLVGQQPPRPLTRFYQFVSTVDRKLLMSRVVTSTQSSKYQYKYPVLQPC